MEGSAPVIIAGGGIAGLTAAWWLHKKNIPFLLLEQSGGVGGKMQSESREGFIIEKGPNTVSLTPALQQLTESLQVQDQVLEAAPVGKNRYLLRNNQLFPLSPHPLKILTTPYLSATAKWKLFTERFVKIRQEEGEESVAAFFERRFGREIASAVIDPVLSGIYAGDITRLSMKEVMPALPKWERESGSVTKGLMKQSGILGGRKTISFKQGFGALATAIYEQIGDRVLLEARVRKISKQLDGYTVMYSRNGISETIPAQKIICTLPAYAAADILEAMDPVLPGLLNGISYPEVWELQLGFEKKYIGSSLDGFGFLVARKENKSFLGCIFSSSLFPGRAPAGKALFTVFIGGARQQLLVKSGDPSAVTAKAIAELQDILHIREEKCFEYLQVWRNAIPQFNVGYERIRAAISTFEKQYPGFYFGGNYVSGVALGDVIKHAAGLVERCVG